jgi:inner membrane protein YidH
VVAHQSESSAQRGFSLAAGVLLLLLGAAAALISARQFRQVAKNLDPAVIPPGYWTQIGVALNVIIALVALSLALHFLVTAQSGV